MSTPKKSLGQHWLHDDLSLEAMVAAADVQPGDMVLEIGPGLGTLTAKLLAHGAKVTAVEFDHDLAVDLPNRLKDENLTVIEQDIMKFNLLSLPSGYKVIANIPYYLTSNLLRVLCESQNPFSSAALLIQKEVAKRVAAEAGDTSLLSISVQFYCQVGLGPIIPAELFTPQPKVDSQILMLEYRKTPLFPDVKHDEFFRMVKAGFSARRKKLRGSLSGGMRISKYEADTLLNKSSISPDLRAQALTLSQWHDLYKAMYT